jgi:hypothetical protein
MGNNVATIGQAVHWNRVEFHAVFAAKTKAIRHLRRQASVPLDRSS